MDVNSELNETTELKEVNFPLDSTTGGLAFSIATGFYIAVSIIAGLIVSLAGLEAGTDGYLYINYLAAPIALASAIAVTLAVRKQSFKYDFHFKCKPKYFIIAVLMIFGLLFSLGWINDLTVEFLKLFGYVPNPEDAYLPDLTGWKIVPAFIVIAILPPLAEEALFRGVILNNAENGMGSIRAILVTGFCFSLFHASAEQTVYQFIAGCAFAFIAVRSRSILPSLVMHIINNGLIVILYACGGFSESGALAVSDGANIAITVISAVCLIGATVWLILDKTPLLKCNKGGVSKFFITASAGIAVLGILWIASLFAVA